MTVPAGAGQPFTLVPGARPVLLTEYAGGTRATQVINLDPAGPRVYLSSSSQVSAASGVPLDPGTAIPWSPSGQLWAMADPAGTKNATIVLTSAVNNWTPSPAAIAAQVAAQLLAGGLPLVYTDTQLTPNGQQILSNPGSVVVDTSGVLSVTIALTVPTVAPVGTRYALTIQWKFGALLISQQTITLHARVGTTLFVQVPVRGPSMTLNMAGDSAEFVNVTVVGSTRPVTGDTITFNAFGSDNAPVLLATGSNSIAAGATTTFYVPAVARAISMRLNAMATTTQINLTGSGNNNPPLSALDFGRWVGTAAVQTINELVVPGIALEVGLQNTDTVAHPMGLTMWDVS